jgi:hypothetical protein
MQTTAVSPTYTASVPRSVPDTSAAPIHRESNNRAIGRRDYGHKDPTGIDRPIRQPSVFPLAASPLRDHGTHPHSRYESRTLHPLNADWKRQIGRGITIPTPPARTRFPRSAIRVFKFSSPGKFHSEIGCASRRHHGRRRAKRNPTYSHKMP